MKNEYDNSTWRLVTDCSCHRQNLATASNTSGAVAGPRDSLNLDPQGGELTDGYHTLRFLRRGRFTEICKVVKAERNSRKLIIKRK